MSTPSTRPQSTPRDGAAGQADVYAWLAHALAAHLGHYRDPAAREAAVGLLPPPVLARAALTGIPWRDLRKRFGACLQASRAPAGSHPRGYHLHI
ncbi:hypothetical protein [Streptomyces sp. NPDC059970]|uniref:hypothetical protein n=1 Tax=Streptomyces sp. NPDC059970 TaxID=3347019 RepID=UPI0036B8EA9A